MDSLLAIDIGHDRGEGVCEQGRYQKNDDVAEQIVVAR
jgi:hypothetical protein